MLVVIKGLPKFSVLVHLMVSAADKPVEADLLREKNAVCCCLFCCSSVLSSERLDNVMSQYAAAYSAPPLSSQAT